MWQKDQIKAVFGELSNDEGTCGIAPDKDQLEKTSAGTPPTAAAPAALTTEDAKAESQTPPATVQPKLKDLAEPPMPTATQAEPKNLAEPPMPPATQAEPKNLAESPMPPPIVQTQPKDLAKPLTPPTAQAKFKGLAKSLIPPPTAPTKLLDLAKSLTPSPTVQTKFKGLAESLTPPPTVQAKLKDLAEPLMPPPATPTEYKDLADYFKSIGKPGMLNGLPETGGYRYCAAICNAEIRPVQDTQSGFLDKIASGMARTIESFTSSSYLIGLASGKVAVVTGTHAPSILALPLHATLAFNDGGAKFSFTLPSGYLSSASVQFKNGISVLWGDGEALLADLDQDRVLMGRNRLNGCPKIRISKPTVAIPFSGQFETVAMASSFVTFDDAGLVVHTGNWAIDFSSVVATAQTASRQLYLTWDQDGFTLFELFLNNESKVSALQRNLIGEPESSLLPEWNFLLPSTLPTTKTVLSAVVGGSLALVVTDHGWMARSDNVWKPASFFRKGTRLWMLTDDHKTQVYTNVPEAEAAQLADLGIRTDALFVGNGPLPCLVDDELVPVWVDGGKLVCNGKEHPFSALTDFSYTPGDGFGMIAFASGEEKLEVVTARAFALRILCRREKVVVSNEIAAMPLSGLYSYSSKTERKDFIAATFSELLKTDRMLNEGMTVSELLVAISNHGAKALRGTISNFIGKFKAEDDLQSRLIAKLSILEVQRRRIQKLMDEWLLCYPHFAANREVMWLRTTFGADVSAATQKSEYWKSVQWYRKTLMAPTADLQKMLSEIGVCLTKISTSIPDSVKCADIPSMLRLEPAPISEQIVAASNAALATGIAITAGTMLLRGLIAVGTGNILMASMAVQQLATAISKDMKQQQDLRSYGPQALEWWQLLMKHLPVHAFEMGNAWDSRSGECSKRDVAILKSLAPENAAAARKKMDGGLKARILQCVETKNREMPFDPKGHCFSDLINTLDAQIDIRKSVFSEFSENILI